MINAQPLRVLLQGRALPHDRQGGDSSLVSRLASELERLGHHVTVMPSAPAGTTELFDLVHVVNLDRSVLSAAESFARMAHDRDIPLVVTPLWWPLDEYIADMTSFTRLAFRAKGTPVARVLRDRTIRSFRTINARQRAVLSQSTAVCPSGDAEGHALTANFGPLAINVVKYGTGARQPSTAMERGGVACVARLDPRKNQLALIHALDGTGIKLTLVGTHDVFPSYAKACMAAAGNNVEFLGYVDSATVTDILRTTRVHALTSYFELPGLTNLDAAANGAAIVAPTSGTSIDYFGGEAFYCDTTVSSVRNALLAAYDAGPSEQLATFVAERYTWQACAAAYAHVYRTSTLSS